MNNSIKLFHSILDYFEIIWFLISFFMELDKKSVEDVFWWSVIISYLGLTSPLLEYSGFILPFFNALFVPIDK